MNSSKLSVRLTSSLILVAALFCVHNAKATVIVRNGGDVIDSFLAQTRESLVQIVASRPLDPKIQPLESGCHRLNELNAAEQDFCEEFVRTIAPGIYQLNRGTSVVPTPFKLVFESLATRDPDGRLRPVAAATDCGSAGPIFFHYDTVRTHSPKQLFFLLAHEFAHKVSFNGQSCVTDNEPVGPFSEVGGGRRLIDAFASVLTGAALEWQLIGDDYAIFDNFKCGWSDERSAISSYSNSSAERVVFDKGRFDHYLTGIGNLPRDTSCPSMRAGQWQWQYALRLTIQEPAGCRISEKTSERFTIVRVMKEYDPLPDGSRRPAEQIAIQTFPNVNPLCDEKPRRMMIPFAHELGTANFAVEYLNTQTAGNRSLHEKLFLTQRFVVPLLKDPLK